VSVCRVRSALTLLRGEKRSLHDCDGCYVVQAAVMDTEVATRFTSPFDVKARPAPADDKAQRFRPEEVRHGPSTAAAPAAAASSASAAALSATSVGSEDKQADVVERAGEDGDTKREVEQEDVKVLHGTRTTSDEVAAANAALPHFNVFRTASGKPLQRAGGSEDEPPSKVPRSS